MAATPSASLPRHAPAADVIALAVGDAVDRLLAEERAIRVDRDPDPERVHQARVATRRLRSNLRMCSGLLDPDWVDAVTAELRWLAHVLGPVRDADVRAARLAEQIARLDAADREAGRRLLAVVADERARAADEMAVALDSARCRAVLGELARTASDLPFTPAASAEAANTFRRLARRRWKPLRKAARRASRAAADVEGAADVEQIHQVRIRAKRFRYAADAAAAVTPAAARHAAAVGVLQDELGELHDAAVAETWLRDQLAGATIAEAFVIGRLVAVQRAEVERRGRDWRPAWRAVRRRKRRAWLRA